MERNKKKISLTLKLNQTIKQKVPKKQSTERKGFFGGKVEEIIMCVREVGTTDRDQLTTGKHKETESKAMLKTKRNKKTATGMTVTIVEPRKAGRNKKKHNGWGGVKQPKKKKTILVFPKIKVPTGTLGSPAKKQPSRNVPGLAPLTPARPSHSRTSGSPTRKPPWEGEENTLEATCGVMEAAHIC